MRKLIGSISSAIVVILIGSSCSRAPVPPVRSEGAVSPVRAGSPQRSPHWLLDGGDLYAVWSTKTPDAATVGNHLFVDVPVPVTLPLRLVARAGSPVDYHSGEVRKANLPDGGSPADFPEPSISPTSDGGWFAFERSTNSQFTGFWGIKFVPYVWSKPSDQGAASDLTLDLSKRASFPSLVQAGPPPHEFQAHLKWNRKLLMNLNGWDFVGEKLSLALALQHPGSPNQISAFISDDHGKFWRGKTLGEGNSPGCALLPGRILITASRWRPLPPSADGIPDVANDKRLAIPGNYHGAAGTLILWRLLRKLDAVTAPTTLVEHGVLSSRMATDGKDRVFLVMVRPAPSDKSALWLMTSKDGGATWDQPEKLTDGKSVDWEPSVIFYHGSVWIAYSHSEAGRLASNIRYIRVKIDPDKS